MDFNKVILMTDVDGTLLTDDKRILPKDMEAIERFRKGGGLFTLATGRGFSMAAPIAEKLKLDIPAVIFNGAAVYDFDGERFLWCCYIDSSTRGYIARLIEEFPHIAIEVLMERNVYVPAINDVERRHLSFENVQPIRCPLSEIPDGEWIKVLIADEPHNIDKIIPFALENFKENVRWVRSEQVYYEMLPLGISKWAGYAKLIELLGAGDRFTVAAGDYYNDMEMIEKANLGVSVMSAQEEVKSASDLVVCDNNSGAISEIIDYIEKL